MSRAKIWKLTAERKPKGGRGAGWVVAIYQDHAEAVVFSYEFGLWKPHCRARRILAESAYWAWARDLLWQANGQLFAV